MAFLEPRDIIFERTKHDAAVRLNDGGGGGGGGGGGDHSSSTLSSGGSRIEATCYRETATFVKAGLSNKDSELKFAQAKLNFLVALVRHGRLRAEAAARIAKGVAVMLPSLAGSADPPRTTLLVSGLPFSPNSDGID